MKHLVLIAGLVATPALSQVADPHAGHAAHAAHGKAHAQDAAPDQPADHTAHQHPADQNGAAEHPDDHAASQHPANHAAHGPAAAHEPPHAPPPPQALSGPAHAADALFDPNEMDAARRQLRKEHGAIISHAVVVDRLETVLRKGRNGYAWDAEAWYGGDIDRLWIKTEGEGAFGRHPGQAEVQLLWSHALDPWFNLQAGVRHDFRPDPDRTHLAIGVEGLAPYWLKVEGALFLSDKGDLTARIEASYDQRLTQKLILQPAAEINLSAQDVPAIGLGSGLSSAELGLRLRYEIVPEFAPYLGIEHERAFGDTADFARAAGEKAGGWRAVLGVRAWF
jgi:copper resistance protein B